MEKYGYKEFKNDLKSKNISRIYYFQGEEEALQEEALNLLEKAVSEKSPAEKCLLYGSSLDINDFFSYAGSASLFGGKRLIIIKEINKIKDAGKKLLSDHLASAADEIFDEALFVFVNPSKPSRSAADELRSLTARLGKIVDFYAPDKKELIDFAGKYLISRGKNTEAANIEYLLETAGENIFDIKNELDKLALFTGENKQVTAKDIDECSGETAAIDKYGLSGPILSGNLNESLKTLEGLLGSGEESMYILNQIYYTLSKILSSIEYTSKGYGDYEIAKRLGMPFRAALEIASKSKKIPRKMIYRKLKMVFDAEYSIKSGVAANSDLRILVAGLCDAGN